VRDNRIGRRHRPSIETSTCCTIIVTLHTVRRTCSSQRQSQVSACLKSKLRVSGISVLQPVQPGPLYSLVFTCSYKYIYSLLPLLETHCPPSPSYQSHSRDQPNHWARQTKHFRKGSLDTFAGSTPPGHGYVSLVTVCVVRPLHLPDHSSRGVLQCVVCPSVNLEFDNREALFNQGLLRDGKKLLKMK
jgi:hypothetical protein